MEGERVVLVDASGGLIGSASKDGVHHANTPLHLAFSVYVFDARGKILLTRRALRKRTWPGVWTNSCCGHPGVDESMEAAIHRRVNQELGIEITRPNCVLPDFAYTATDASGVVENEICPVYVADTVHPSPKVSPNVAEVLEFAWVEWSDMATAMSATPFAFSPWSVAQVARLVPTRRP